MFPDLNKQGCIMMTHTSYSLRGGVGEQMGMGHDLAALVTLANRTLYLEKERDHNCIVALGNRHNDAHTASAVWEMRHGEQCPEPAVPGLAS
jgi:hypothetical protein